MALVLAPRAESSLAAEDPAPRLELPPYSTRILDNGLTLLLMPHGTVPMVNLEMWILDGSSADPQGMEGLALLTARSLRKGAGGRSAAEFSEAVDFLGAGFSASADHDRIRIAMQCLSKDLDEALSLFGDAVLSPAFDDGEIEKLARQMAENVRQAKENPRFVLGRYHDAHVFGDHPYGRPVAGTEESLLSITPEQVRRFYREHVGADRAYLAVVGDIDPEVLAGKLERIFAKMPRAEAPAVHLLPPTPFSGREVLLVDKVDTPQTWFMIGNLGPRWGEGNDAAIEVVRTIFGGRFTSWLNTKLRIESGLSYGARFTVQRRRWSGSTFISSFTAKATTTEAIDLALSTLERLHREGISEEELVSAKAYLKGQLPYRYETGDALATALCRITAYGLGRGSIDGLFDRIDAVTLADCRDAVAKWFPADDLAFTCIGVASEVREALSAYGKVRVRENSDPGFD